MKHEISVCGFLFMFFTLSCNEPVIDQSPLNQKQAENAQLKSATIGTTYYVSTSGNNKNPGSEQLPLLTADYAAAKVNPGDIVIFENGVYTTTSGKFFASLSNITISPGLTFAAA